jgi:hypothetical protein
MFKNSQIQAHQTADGAHLTLKGEFNASLATQLLHHMRAFYDHDSSIYIHTDGITAFEPLGLSIFHYNIESMQYEFARFVLTGKNASYLMNVWPSDSLPIWLNEVEETAPTFYF